MFLDFYRMRDQPFGVTPDPRFLYLGKSHCEALASLYYGIESDRGFVTLIAPPGLGKTTLAFRLLEKLQQASRTVFLFQTQCNSRELFQYLLNSLGVDAESMEMVSMHNKLNEILCREMLAGRRFVLAIDEAQNLDSEVLETIRLLSNFETATDKLLQILLIGQPQLARKLASPELEQLKQRISIFARLEPFSSADVDRYITHRLKVAGYEGDPLFTPGALRIIAEQSQGIPRKINGLCFGALSLACAIGSKRVDVAMVEEVIADRDAEHFQQPRVAERVVPSQVTPRPALSSYPPAQVKKSFGQWTLGAATIAAAIVIGTGILSFSPGRIDRAIQISTDAWTSIRSSMGVKANSATVSSALDFQTAELPNSEAVQASPLRGDDGTMTVIVQPGETLRRIIFRTMGKYSGEMIEQVRKLNPAIADFDRLEAGQAIKLPRVPSPDNSAPASDGARANGRN
jgi:type II secretory pathway predicted ATPase ExeA